MANVLNRTTKEILYSVNTPDYDPAEWIIDPDLTILETVPLKYCKIVGDLLVEMTPAEKAVVDAAELAAFKVAKVPQVVAAREARILYGPGVEYPASSGNFLPCTDGDQSRWLGWESIGGKWAALGLSYPFRVYSRDGLSYVDVANAQGFSAVVEAMWVYITALFTEAQTVIQDLLAATTLAEAETAVGAYIAGAPEAGDS